MDGWWLFQNDLKQAFDLSMLRMDGNESQFKDYCRVGSANTNNVFNFQESHPRVFQFAMATPDGTTIMFNLLKCIIEDVVATNSLDNDPIVMNTFDIINAFNTLQRQHINYQMAAGCLINLDPQTSKQWHGWDLLRPIFKAH